MNKIKYVNKSVQECLQYTLKCYPTDHLPVEKEEGKKSLLINFHIFNAWVENNIDLLLITHLCI